MAVPSPEEVEAARTPGGGWTREQLAEWGVSWPPPAGWKKRLAEQWQNQRHSAPDGCSADPSPIVEIYTDGACDPNPGPGGWGAILRYQDRRKEMHGADIDTTSNRMEMTAAIIALETLTRPSVVHLYTDSQYLRTGITQWIRKWKRNGWTTRGKQPVKNVDLWQRLDAATQRHKHVEWFWIKGHAGHPGNERADELAAQGAQEAAAELLAHQLGPGPASMHGL